VLRIRRRASAWQPIKDRRTRAQSAALDGPRAGAKVFRHSATTGTCLSLLLAGSFTGTGALIGPQCETTRWTSGLLPMKQREHDSTGKHST